MQNSFSPSINIIRDFNKEIEYISTPNTKRIFQQIVDDYKLGIRSFNIIGSYGTGKSAFLLAFEHNLKGESNTFNSINGQFANVETFEFLNIVGEYNSILKTFAKNLDIKTNTVSEEILGKIEQYCQEIKEQKACWVIVIDEFGKFLEYAAQNNPEKELYFIQRLAEYANDKSRNILFITTLHQNFGTYAQKLGLSQRREWEKVKGRLKELTFNEPVEQLLNLAAHYIESKFSDNIDKNNIKSLVSIINKTHTFPQNQGRLTKDLAYKLLPFDPLAAAVLTLALQKYGQNERSLFTFLISNDRFSINNYDKKQNPYYNLSCVYDYLLYNYYSLLTTKYNPHYIQWAAIKRAIERIEVNFEGRINDASKLVKTIGLLNIFATTGAKINWNFLRKYIPYCLNIKKTKKLIEDLEKQKIIRHISFKDKYILFEGTDLDIELAILDAAKKIDEINNIVISLKKYFDFPCILAKAVSYKYGTPRFFEFLLSESPIQTCPEDEIDGIINLIFSDTITQKEIEDISIQNNDKAILCIWYKNTNQIRDILFEIEKINYVIIINKYDMVAKRELENIRAYQIEELNRIVLNNLYINSKDLICIFDGKEIKIKNISSFNKHLSVICESIYSKTPTFKNELINRHKTSGVITSARRNFIKALVENWTKEDLGFPKNKFPPEKTIYFTLLKNTGIHCKKNGIYILSRPTESSFLELWKRCEIFLESAKHTQKNLKEIVEILSTAPFKLKKGLINFWLPIFLFIEREEFALYCEQAYVPNITFEILELINKKPHKFQIKTFNVEGVRLELFNKYRMILNQIESGKFTNKSFIETIKPFLTFYKDLPEYTKNTKRLSKSAIKLREVIVIAKDPEKTFFEDFPHALGYVSLDIKNIDDSELQNYISRLLESIRELQTCFDELINRIEIHLLKEMGYSNLKFLDYKTEIAKRYKKLKKYLLLPYQKTFCMRLMPKLNDRKSWISSIAQAVLHKNVVKMKDEEENILFDKLSNIIRELDNLCEITEKDIDTKKEEVVGFIEITSFSEGTKKQIVRLPKEKKGAVLSLEEELKKVISNSDDKTVNIAALVKILQKELKR